MPSRFIVLIAGCLAALIAVVWIGYEAGVRFGGAEQASRGQTSSGQTSSGQSRNAALSERAQEGAGESSSAAGSGAAASAGAGAGGAAAPNARAGDPVVTASVDAAPSSAAGGEPPERLAAPLSPEARDAAENLGVDVDALQEIGASAPRPAAAPRGVDDPPVFDTVRVEPDGSAVLAGRAAPNAIVEVSIDGQKAETVRADSRGEFVAVIAAPTAPAASPVRRIDLASRASESAPERKAAAPVIITAPTGQSERAAVLRPGPLGVDLLQAPSKVADGQVSIDQVTYGESGTVRVSGRGAPGQTARVYLDNALEAEARVTDAGDWNVELTRDIAPALYTLRVDVTAPSGDVSGRAETPFERAAEEDIKLQKGAVVVQPGNNLWKIADFVYGDGTRYSVIYQSNRDQIRNPDLIYPGQVFRLPEAGPDGGPDAAPAAPKETQR